MKRQFLISIFALFLMATSSYESLYGAAIAAEETIAGASRAAAERVAGKVGFESAEAAEAAISKLATSMEKSASEMIEKMGLTVGKDTEAMFSHMEGTAEESLKNLGKMDEIGLKSFDNLSSTLSKDFASQDEALLRNQFGESAVQKLKQAEIGSLEAVEGIGSKAAGEEGAVVKSEEGAVVKGETKLSPTDEVSMNKLEADKLSAENAAQYAKEHPILTKVNKSMTAFAEKNPIISGAFGKVIGMAEIVGMAVLFMIPSIFQSSYLAQQQRNALLQSYSAPIKFGNTVLQIPDSAFNMDDPAQTDFVYYGIPVANPGASLNAGAASMYPGVTGPDKNNKVTKGIHNDLQNVVTFGGAKDSIGTPRYNLSDAAMSQLPLYVSYGTNSWETWGTSAIPDATFGQVMINLNTGYVFYADGLSDNVPAVPLVGPLKTATGGDIKTVQSYASTKMGKTSTSGTASSYTEYVNTFSTSKGAKTASAINNQFNCACLELHGDVLSDDVTQACNTTNTCLLTKALGDLSAGMILNRSGQKLGAGQDIATEVANGALGQVRPIRGLGDTFQAALNSFPPVPVAAGATSSTPVSSGILTVNLGAVTVDASGNISVPDASGAGSIMGADADNYAAKGVYVYECKNTPFAKMLRSLSPAAANNPNITDYIVFLDKNLNQVPLMVPVQNPANYNFVEMGLNPAITSYSTIIGNSDSSGGFSLLPALNITVQGTSYVPLYGWADQNGVRTATVGYNANLNSKIGAISQALEAHTQLGQQFKMLKAGMLRLLYQGPFTKYNLKPVDVSMQPVIGGVNLAIYTGFNAYPMTQSENCTDVLIPLAGTKTAVLPSSQVTSYMGLVSDLLYTVQADGSLVVLPARPGPTNANGTPTTLPSGFANSLFSVRSDNSWALDLTKKDSYYNLGRVQTQGGSGYQLPQPLVDFVKARRAEWVAWLNRVSGSGLLNQEFLGLPWTGAVPSRTLTILGHAALVNQMYVYTCSPNPSKLAQDYFVLTNSSTPLATDPALGTLSASSPSVTAATNMLSIISGILYDSKGQQVKNSLGVAYQVSGVAGRLLQAKPAAFTDDFKTTLQATYMQFLATANAMVYPFEFYNLKLGMYQADIDRGAYIYFDASGAGTSTSFKPKDYFVAVDLDASPVVWQQQISSSTKYVMSLVSGQVYSKTGPQYKLPAAQLATVVSTLSPTWRPTVAATSTTPAVLGIKDNIARLTAELAAVLKAESTEVISDAGTGSIVWTQADVVAMINAVKGLDYLPDPFVMLKQDPGSKNYIQVSPASTDGSDFLYTFFDIPNSYKDAQGNLVRLGGMFDSNGNLLLPIADLQLKNLLVQNGIALDANNKQVLCAANIQPIMMLDPADFALQPGATGKSMIHASSPDFPSIGIMSPITYQGRQGYFYYNTIMKAYYVMEINGTDTRYISMAGGDIYNLDGTCRPVLRPVAINQANPDDMLLPYLNGNSYTQCILKNTKNNGLYSDFVNIEKNFKGNSVLSSVPVAVNLLVASDLYNQVNIVQSPRPDTIPPMPDLNFAMKYSVYWDTAQTAGSAANPIYMVNTDYKYQTLVLLPINMVDRSMLSPMPAAIYKNTHLIFNKGVIDHMVFAGNMYKVDSVAGSIYSMKLVANPAAAAINLSMKKDARSGINYYEIVAGTATYNYQIIFDELTSQQLTSYQYNAWQAETVADISAKIILVQFLPKSSSGSVQLGAVGLASVADVPGDAAIQASMTRTLSRVKQDAVEGRFVATIFAAGGSDDQGPFYDYFNQAGYVDLETGALFDTNGVPVGFTLNLSDLTKLLNKLNVMVIRDNKTKQAVLVYRPSAPVAAQPAPVVAASANSSGILGRFSSAVAETSSNIQSGLFGWVQSAMSWFGSMIFGN